MLDRPAPMDLEAERRVLGSIFCGFDNDRSAEIVAKVAAILDDSLAFGLPEHQTIYAAVLKLWRAGCKIDADVVRHEVPSIAFSVLVELHNVAVSDANAEYYARAVLEQWRRRQAIQLANHLQESAHAPCYAQEGVWPTNGEFDAALAETRANLAAIQDAASIGPTEIDDVIQAVQDDFDTGKMRSVLCGIGSLDEVCGGFPIGGLTIVAARTSMGKSTLLLNAFRNAMRHKRRAAFYSLEMSQADIVVHLVSSMTGKPSQDIVRGLMPPDERRECFEHVRTMLGRGVGALHCDKITGPAIEASVRAEHERKPLAVVFIDYIQLAMIIRKGQREDQALGELTSGFERLARELGFAMVVASQVNRECETRRNKRPTLHDLRGSGNLEQDAHAVWLLYRPHYYDDAASKDILEVNVAKQRMGPQKTVELLWQGECFRIGDRPNEEVRVPY